MFDKLVLAPVAFVLTLVASITAAQALCSSYPYAFSTGTTAVSSQVNQDFACAALTLSPTISDLFLGTTSDADSNNGALGVYNGNGYLYLNGTTADGIVINGDGTHRAQSIVLAAGSSGPVTISSGGTAVASFTGSSELINQTSVLHAERLGITMNGATQNGIIIYDSSATSGAAFMDFFSATTNIGYITNNGNTGVLYNTASDARLKSVLPEQKDYHRIISDLWVGDFEWKKYKSRGFGILAQQAYSLYPEAITKPADEAGIWQADYSKLAPLALWGVKDLYKATDKQNIKLSSLEDQVKSLASKIASLQHANDNQTAQIDRLEEHVTVLQRKLEIQTAQK